VRILDGKFKQGSQADLQATDKPTEQAQNLVHMQHKSHHVAWDKELALSSWR